MASTIFSDTWEAKAFANAFQTAYSPSPSYVPEDNEESYVASSEPDWMKPIEAKPAQEEPVGEMVHGPDGKIWYNITLNPNDPYQWKAGGNMVYGSVGTSPQAGVTFSTGTTGTTGSYATTAGSLTATEMQNAINKLQNQVVDNQYSALNNPNIILKGRDGDW